MKHNILLKTNILVCLVVFLGFLATAVLSCQMNYSASVKNIEQVSELTSEGIYYQLTTLFAKPVNISLTMANDSLLRRALLEESSNLNNPEYEAVLTKYLKAYHDQTQYDSVFLVSAASQRYYNYAGLDRVLSPENPENDWYYAMAASDQEYAMNVDNDEVKGKNNEITVFVNCKITDDQGQLLGIVGVGLQIDSLQTLIQSYEDQYQVQAFLINSAGDIEISSHYTGYERMNLFSLYPYQDEVQKQILSWHSGDASNPFWVKNPQESQGQDYVISRYIPQLQWHLFVRQDTGELLRSLQRQLWQSALIIMAIILFILYIITRVIRTFNLQIIELTQSVEQEKRSTFEKATEELFDNIYELDITHNCPADTETQKYFESLGAPAGTPYDQALKVVAEKQIKAEFRQGYVDTFTPANVIRAYENGQDTLTYEFMISTGGDYFWMRITARIIQQEKDQSLHMLTYRQNIDAEKRQEKRLQALAQTDEMTHLLTKSATRRHIEQKLQTCPDQQFAFFIFDIDTFKEANDRYGHVFGDTVIEAFAAALCSQFRQDDIIGRIGGDEFAVFYPITGPAAVEDKAKALSKALNKTHTALGCTWMMSASIGIALAPQDGCNFETLYQSADAALYQTKKHGKNSYSFFKAVLQEHDSSKD